MDLGRLLKSSYSDYSTIILDYWYSFFSDGFRSNLIFLLIICSVISLIVYGMYMVKQWQMKKISQRSENESNQRLRFRKRDKMLFYGRRMLRKVKNLSGQAYNGQGKKRRAVMRFARRILQLRKENTPLQLKQNEPPAEYLEETIEGNEKVPPDALYLLQSIRVFGHFEKPVFLKLCKHTEIIQLNANEFLFSLGESDENVYIVQTGLINVLINNPDGTTISLKHVRPGDTVTSLLSFVDVLIKQGSIYKSVTARAIQPSIVIKLPMKAFMEVFDENPDILVRIVQVIMVRLQRVTYTVLRNYLGLNIELAQNIKHNKKTQAQNQKTSPGHKRTHSNDVTHIPGGFLQSASHPPSTNVPDQRPDMIADLTPNNRRIAVLPSAILNEKIDEVLLKNIGVEGFLRELSFLDQAEESYLMKNIEVREVQPGTTLIHEGSLDDNLIYLIGGNLSVFQQSVDMPGTKQKEKTEIHIHSVHPGEIIGGLAVLTGEASLITVRAKHYSRIALLKKEVIYNLLREKPSVIIDIARSVIRRLSPLVRQCDFALDWVFLESGRAVYRQDEPSDCTYIVLSGRLRSVKTHENGKKEIVGEYGKGDLIGIVEMITETSRSTTVIAVRDSELAKLPEGLFNAIKLKYPSVVTQLISLLGHRILGSLHGSPVEATPVNNQFSTVAIVPTSEEVCLTAFTYELYHSLCAICPTLRLTSDLVRKTLGVGIMETSNEYRLTSWLAEQEDRVKIALYQCDNSLTPWTQRCLRQADVILIIGLGDHPPIVGKIEREIDRLAMRTQKELVLLHQEGSPLPTNTVQWLNMRTWVTKHHHLQCPKRMFTRRSQYRINELYSKVLMSEPNMHSDFSRLARWLTGNSVGLVLGGGGARGAAHVGMLKAIQEAGIPIDMVGGVSIGAFMGALWCSEKNITTVTQKAREWSKKMTQWGRQLLDLTYPVTSMFTGRDFNQTIRGTFGDIYIEDMFIPYFTLTTDITASCGRVHTHGSLWRYVRSSMSLSGYMPPLCDPKDGHLLLDGGYVNNLPADIMRAQGAAHIIAIDVGSQDDKDLTDYGDDLSGWWLLYKRLNPFTSPVKVPNLPDIQSRLAYVSCVRQLELVKNSDYCEYIRPPIDNYKTLAFGSFDEIRDVGYVFGKNYFDQMAKNGRLSRFTQWYNKEMPSRYSHSINDYTFTDLAQIVCRIPETYADKHQSSSSSDEEFDGYISEPSTYVDSLRMRFQRSGGSLSFSENEMDSDIEMPLPFKFKKRSNSTSDISPETELPKK